MLGGADNPNGELPSYITGADTTSPVVTQLHGRLCTEPVKSQARDSFGDAVGRVFDTAESSSLLPAPLKKVIRTVRDAVVSVARAVWDWIFF